VIILNSKKIKLKINIEYLLLFLTGFFGLSALSYVITSNLGIPYLIEIYFVPLLVYYYKYNRQIFKISTNSRSSVLVFMLLYVVMGSTIIGVIRTSNVLDIITMIRPFIYIILLIYFLINKSGQRYQANSHLNNSRL
jgi:hypothetical protein